MMSQIKKVRQSIMQRKKNRDFDNKKATQPDANIKSEKQVSYLPQEEEKHGFSAIPEVDIENKPDGDIKVEKRTASGMLVKAVLSGVLFAGMFYVLQTDDARISKQKGWVSEALTENFQFAKANAWYQGKFGSPLAVLPAKEKIAALEEPDALPVAGIISESFEANGKGVKISADKPSNVNAMKEGIVVYAGTDRQTGRTIVVQHEDGSKSKYGNLSKLDVHLYQYVAQNQKIAKFAPTEKSQSVYYSIERNKQYVDPAPVIKVDDRS